MTELKNKNILVKFAQSEYDEAKEYKETQHKLSWREMIMEYVAIKKAEEQGD